MWDPANAKEIYAVWPLVPLLIFKTVSGYHSDLYKSLLIFSHQQFHFLIFPFKNIKGNDRVVPSLMVVQNSLDLWKKMHRRKQHYVPCEL